MASGKGGQKKVLVNTSATQDKATTVKVPAKTGSAQPGPVSSPVVRSCNEHKFLTEVADVRHMETGLLKLLDDFHQGKLQVFGRDCTFEQMDQVREQQEKLARLHFDLDGQTHAAAVNAEESKELAEKNLGRLLEELEGLGKSIQGLKSSSRAGPCGNDAGADMSAATTSATAALLSQLPKAPPRNTKIGKVKSKAAAATASEEMPMV